VSGQSLPRNEPRVYEAHFALFRCAASVERPSKLSLSDRMVESSDMTITCELQPPPIRTRSQRRPAIYQRRKVAREKSLTLTHSHLSSLSSSSSSSCSFPSEKLKVRKEKGNSKSRICPSKRSMVWRARASSCFARFLSRKFTPSPLPFVLPTAHDTRVKNGT